jgi:hypothetical protein
MERANPCQQEFSTFFRPGYSRNLPPKLSALEIFVLDCAGATLTPSQTAPHFSKRVLEFRQASVDFARIKSGRFPEILCLNSDLRSRFPEHKTIVNSAFAATEQYMQIE